MYVLSTYMTTRFNMRLDQSLKKKIGARASELGISTSSFVKVALAEKLERDSNA